MIEATQKTPAQVWADFAATDSIGKLVAAVITAWNAAAADPAASKVLYRLFGFDVSGGSRPTHALSTTHGGSARPVGDAEYQALSDIVRKAKGG